MRQKRQGFTLVEIIFSIAFLSVVSVVILQLFLTSDRLAQSAQKQNFATLYAANAIELAKAQADANELPLSATAEVEQYFDKLWHRMPSIEEATYRLTLALKREPDHPGVIYLTAVVYDRELKVLAKIDTAHYLKGGQ